MILCKFMRDAELCKELLQRILPDLEIDNIEYPERWSGKDIPKCR